MPEITPYVTAYSGGDDGCGNSIVRLHMSDGTVSESRFPTPKYGPLVILPRGRR